MATQFNTHPIRRFFNQPKFKSVALTHDLPVAQLLAGQHVDRTGDNVVIYPSGTGFAVMAVKFN